MNMDNLRDASDAALVVAIGRWSEEALAEVYRRHGEGVLRPRPPALERQGAGGGDPAGGVPAAVEHTRALRLRAGQPALLLAQTHGRSVDLLRSETSRRRRDEREAREFTDSGDDIEREVIDLTVSEKVKEVVAALPTDERQAIELAYFRGHTYRQVAVMLQAQEGTVKSRIRSGLRRLRTALADAGVGATWAES